MPQQAYWPSPSTSDWGGALLAESGWASGAADVVLGEVVLIVLGRLAIRRREGPDR